MKALVTALLAALFACFVTAGYAATPASATS